MWSSHTAHNQSFYTVVSITSNAPTQTQSRFVLFKLGRRNSWPWRVRYSRGWAARTRLANQTESARRTPGLEEAIGCPRTAVVISEDGCTRRDSCRPRAGNTSNARWRIHNLRACLFELCPDKGNRQGTLGYCLGRYEERAGRFPIVKPKESDPVWVKISASLAGWWKEGVWDMRRLYTHGARGRNVGTEMSVISTVQST